MRAILETYYNLKNEEEEMVTDIIEYNTDEEVREYCRKYEKTFNSSGYECHFNWSKFEDGDIIDIRGAK